MKTKCKYLLLIMISLSSCKSTKSPENGSLDKDLYKNLFFNFSLPIPPSWIVQDSKKLHEDLSQFYKLTHSEEETDSILSKSHNLLKLQKYQTTKQGEYNPSILLSAEKIQDSKLQSGKDYLISLRNNLKQQGNYYEFYTDVEDEVFGGKSFNILYVHLIGSNPCIMQKYYATIINGYYLIFRLMYDCSDEMQNELIDIIGGIKFNNSEDSNKPVSNNISEIKTKNDYFKIVKIDTQEFTDEASVFHLVVDVRNNTPYKCDVGFKSNIIFYFQNNDKATTVLFFKFDEKGNENKVNHNYYYNRIQNWEPGTIRKLDFISYGIDNWRDGYNRTPTKINLTIDMGISSIDLETNSYILVQDDLLRFWKKKQTTEGLR